jgi:phenylalanyl-tRNA synthetase alpha chain
LVSLTRQRRLILFLQPEADPPLAEISVQSCGFLLHLKHTFEMSSKHLADIKEAARHEIKNAPDVKTLEAARAKYLGRRDGELTKILRSLADLPLAQRRKIGPAANALRKELETEFEKKLIKFGSKTAVRDSRLDITMPGKKIPLGHRHPLTLMEQEIREIFRGLNFSVVEGPEIETEYYNFDALNIPANHPARDMWDTFWLTDSQKSHLLLRTHTSPMQIRYMETHRPPFQIIVPGRVFRYEATDASHEINFYQVEGLMIGSDVTLANFKYIIQTFFKQLFGPEVHLRFRPSYFPFVEPGLEVDIKILNRGTGEESRWLEVMGAGMVHPNVFKAVKYDPREIQGFAFGLGLDRLAMIKYGIPDIRLFYSGDLRFINQF